MFSGRRQVLRLRQRLSTGIDAHVAGSSHDRTTFDTGLHLAYYRRTGPSVTPCRGYHVRNGTKLVSSPQGALALVLRRAAHPEYRFGQRPLSSRSASSQTLPADDEKNSMLHSPSVLITGGTSGIGFAIAKQAVLRGASEVRIVTRSKERGQAAVARLREASTKSNIDFVEAETVAYGDTKLFQKDGAQSPHFTTIIHSAGITQTSLLASTRSEDIKTILAVNLESAALLSKAHLKRYMQACMNLNRRLETASAISSDTPSWQIVNVASLLAIKGGVGSSIYAASKAGLIALTRATALEAAEIAKRYSNAFPPRFRANVVLPGYVDTPMTHSISQRTRDTLLEQIPVGRFGTPDEVAHAVMFLLGNEYANNCVLNLDGGLSAV